jgi:hypothetical protein
MFLIEYLVDSGTCNLLQESRQFSGSERKLLVDTYSVRARQSEGQASAVPYVSCV